MKLKKISNPIIYITLITDKRINCQIDGQQLNKEERIDQADKYSSVGKHTDKFICQF